MIVTCQACGAANDDEARFCDQCGAALAGALSEVALAANVPLDSPAAMTASTQAIAPSPPTLAAPTARAASTNWLGLAVIALVLAGMGYFLFGSRSAATDQPAGTEQPAEVFGKVQKQLEKDKQSLVRDPLDNESLKDMYNLYGQIGRTEKVTEYLDKAIAELRQRHDSGKLDSAATLKQALDLAMIAMNGGDTLGAVAVLKYYYEVNPGRVSTAAMIANIYYDLGQAQDAIEWYTKFLAVADPAKEGSSYVNAQVDRATMRLKLAADGDAAQLKTAVVELRQITQAHGEHWAARFNLGQALLQSGDKPAAEREWTASRKLAQTPEEKWRTDDALALLHGQPEPPKPADMDVSQPGSMEDMPNPHAGVGMPPPGSPNPHTGASPAFGQGAGH